MTLCDPRLFPAHAVSVMQISWFLYAVSIGRLLELVPFSKDQFLIKEYLCADIFGGLEADGVIFDRDSNADRLCLDIDFMRKLKLNSFDFKFLLEFEYFCN